MSTQVIAPPRYLATARDASLVADIALVLGGTALITASAFVIVPLPFTPVPIALSTFTVMATGAALGPLRGTLSAALYVLIGMLGAPVFANGHSGVAFPTFGYLIGYVIAAWVVGQLARHQADRRVGTTLALGALGTLILYACGVPWLAVSLGIDLGMAIQLGVVPFLIGDTLKVLALAGLLPSLWRLVARIRPDDRAGAR
ncbi:biotin transporter BioY [Propioniciclava flava]|uniref:Biotin transporter n=1 Tax=Propioniciclava flava TaxID=2072026 RepID=A0A4Q2EJ20_9ACTN|nr:biotin transporter BioY [Propioniciclava flava]RXW33531.1 biotin transporter BioY [Propioniciclava flava]